MAVQIPSGFDGFKRSNLPSSSTFQISDFLLPTASHEIYNQEIKIYNSEQWNQIVEEKKEAQRIEDAKARHLEEIKMQSLASTVETEKNEESSEEVKEDSEEN